MIEEKRSRTVLVTGASSGIGFNCARNFASRGWTVVAQFHRNQDPVSALEREFGVGRVFPVGADLSTEAGCVKAVGAVPNELDALVHSAGIWNDGHIRELTGACLEEMFRTNTFSSYFLSREAVNKMEHGSLVYIGSTAGQRGEPGHSHYAGSKAALWGLVQSLAQELAPSIRVNLVSPGWVRTPMAEEALAEAGREEKIVSGVPLRRIAESEDVTEAVRFLTDDSTARHLTGLDIGVSGGALLPLPRG
ncbi:MAG: SDR family oxidoreductase [bacterium]|nr:SDR family oxidoreductase [bacterium]